MFFKSKNVAILIAFFISLSTTAFLSLLDEASLKEMAMCAIISFIASFTLVFYTFEYLIFDEIKKIYRLLDKIKNKNFQLNTNTQWGKNPFNRINEEIFSYAAVKQQEIEELKKLEVFRREFLADVSHELKTPIFAAQGFVHTLIDGAVDDKKVRMKFLKKAAKNLDGLDLMVQDLLTISQMETGTIKMHPEYFDIRQFTEDIIDQLEDKALKKQIKINIKQDFEGEVLVYADPKRMKQVLTNLISNSLKYGKEEGKVLITFTKGKDMVNIEIKDNGIGIPQAHQERIFERFYRVEKSRSKDQGGTGLGLAIVKHIIEAHGTKVQLKSVVNKGAAFSFKLPITMDNNN